MVDSDLLLTSLLLYVTANWLILVATVDYLQKQEGCDWLKGERAVTPPLS